MFGQMVHDFIWRFVSVSLRVKNRLGDLDPRETFPPHAVGSKAPFRCSGHAGEFTVFGLVASFALSGCEAVVVFASLDAEVVRVRVFALFGDTVAGVTVRAALMSQHLHHFVEVGIALIGGTCFGRIGRWLIRGVAGKQNCRREC